MKLTAIISAGLIGAAAMLSPTAASAQMQPMQHEQAQQQQAAHSERHVVVTRRTHVEQRSNGWRRDRVRRVCKVTYRHHQRIRRCRTIRTHY